MTMTLLSNATERGRMLPLLLSLLLAFSSVGVGAQDTACDSIFECTTCLANRNGCVFAVGTCFAACEEPDNGATCYSTSTFPTLTDAEDICELYDTDNARCTSQRNCGDCTTTLKSDGKPCQWYESAGACFGGGTGPFGSGAMTCPGAETTTAPVPVPIPSSTPAPPTSKPPTLAPTVDDLLDQADCLVQTDCEACTSTILSDGTTACTWFVELEQCSNVNCMEGVCGVSQCTSSTPEDETSVCQASADNCQTCLQANCAWFPLGNECAPSCADLPADAECYATGQQQGDATTICQLADTNDANRELCFAQMECSTCTSTLQSDGTPCQWYVDDATGVEWCQTGGCNQNGVCGSDTCDGAPGVEVVPEINVTTPTMPPGENATLEDTTASENITVTTDGDSTTATDDACQAYDGYGSDGCLPCLSSSSNCAWILETCVPDCADIADAPCYSPTTFPGLSNEEICEQASVSQEDVALCGSKNYCFTCTSTIKSDGVSTCSWYTNGEEEWCDVGGCNAEGICGESDEAVCQQPQQQPEPQEPEPQSPTDNGSTANGSAPESSANTKSILIALVLGMVATMKGLY